MIYSTLQLGNEDAAVHLQYRLIFPDSTAFWAFAFATSTPQAFHHDSIEFDTMASHDYALFRLLDEDNILFDSPPIPALGEAPVQCGREVRSEATSSAHYNLSSAGLLFGAFVFVSFQASVYVLLKFINLITFMH